MTTLRVVVDEIISTPRTAIGRYSAEIIRAIIESAPPDCDVEAVVGALSPEARPSLQSGALRGATITPVSLPSRELAVAWQLGVALGGGGLLHSPSLLAPLGRHSRAEGNQATVTVHDVDAWTNPGALRPIDAAWTKAMMRRTRRHADAVVVSTHALAQQLSEIVSLGDRIRVVPSGPRSDVVLPDDAGRRAARMKLPDHYVVIEHRDDDSPEVSRLTQELATAAPGLAVVHLCSARFASSDDDGPSADESAHWFSDLDGMDRAAILSRAAAYVLYRAGAGVDPYAVLDAMRLAVPVVHLEADALTELTQDCAVRVEHSSDYPAAVAHAVAALVADDRRSSELRIAASDRVRLFSWRSAGEQIWRLHADL